MQRKFYNLAKKPFLLNIVLYSFWQNSGLDRDLDRRTPASINKKNQGCEALVPDKL